MVMKKHVLLLVSLCLYNISFGQLSGYFTIPGDFPSIESAISVLNSQGVGPGGITFNVAAGLNETFSSPNSGLITTTGTADNPVIFQKSGSGPHPLITAYSPGSGSMDFIICLAGADYFTFDGIDIRENPANLSPVSQVEWGFALLKSSGLNGSQHVTIKNSSITLNANNSSTCAVYSGNHAYDSNTPLVITNLSGTNSYNSFSGLSISDSYNAIYIKGFEDESPFAYYDQANEIGTGGPNTINGLGNNSGTITSYGIYCSGQNGIKAANNLFTGSCNNSTGSLYVISLLTGTNSSVDVWNNVISMSYLGTGAFYGIYSSGMGAAGTSNSANVHHNSVSNNSIPNFTGNTVGYIYISTGCVTANLYNNTIEGNTAGSTSVAATGTLYYAYFSSNPTVAGTINIYQNEINRNKRVQSVNGGGATYLLYNGGSGNVLNEMENNIDSITISSTGTTYGLYTLFSGSVKNVHHNSVTNIFNAKGTVYAVYNGNGSGAGFFHSNKVQNVSTTSVSGKLYGIYQSSGINQFHYNNTVSQLYAPQATANPAIFGIYLSGAVKTGAYNNTVYLDASSSGASFGVTGIFASSSIEVELKNNIIVNNSTPGPQGRNVAYQRSSNVFSTYSVCSNNNNFYAGQPGGFNYIYYDGTNLDLTLQNYRNRVSPRDANSVTESTPFVNTGVTPYDLHIQTSVPNQCESSGATILSPISISTDAEGTPRFPNEGYPYNPDSGVPVNAPDIGASEFGGMVLDITAPDISFIPLSNTSGTGDRVLATTITDATGVPTVGTGLPVLYWRINNGSYAPVSATWLEGNTYSFTFGAGVLLGDVVSYYIVAQDLVSPMPNVGADPYGGSGGFAPNPPACNLAPVTPYTYLVVGSLAGVYPIGSGKAYATLSEALADLNNKEVTGPVIYELWDTVYSSAESFPIMINEYPGTNPDNTVTIRPKEGLTVKVTGSSPTGIMAINGANNIILDGAGLEGSGRHLIFENTSNQANSYVIGLFNNGFRGAQNNTVSNCVLKAGSKFSNTYAIFLSPVGGDYDNTVISNNELLNAMTGIQFAGFQLGINHNGLITGNTFGSDDNTVTLGNSGLSVSNTDGLVISGNIIKNLFTNSNPKGINIGINTVNTTITGNTISGIVFSGTSGGGGKGIDVNTGSELSNLTISNNLVFQISGDGWNTFGTNSIAGIRLMGNTGGIKLYFNTVRLTGTIYRDGAISDISAAFYAAATVTDIDARNNIFTNSINNATGAAKAFSVYSDAPATSYYKLNYNDYYSSGPEAILGYLGVPAANLAAWQAVSLQDEFSYDMDPLFVSPTDLHPSNTGLDNKGFYMPSIPADIAGVQRTDPPDMGPLEFGINPEISTLAASRISCGGATLNGTIDPRGLTVDTYFDYGPDLSYGSTVAGTPFTVTGTTTIAISADISMPPSSTFHYRARGVTAAGVTVFSNDQVITTLPAGNPVTYTLPASNIGEITATLNGTVNAHCSPATVIFEYGITTGYGNTVPATMVPLNGDTTWLLSSDISGLEVNTLYHFRCVAENETGTTYGDDLTFSTICPVLIPTISGEETSCISTTCQYSTESGMTSYSWTVSEGGQIISGEGTSTIMVYWNTAGEQTLAVSYANSNGCQAASPALMDVTVNALPEPSIDGSNIACEKTDLGVYTTQEGFINYAWEVSSGGTIITGQGTYQVEISWNTPGENTVSVNYSDLTGCTAVTPAVFDVEVLPFPGSAGPVTGTPQLCAGTRSVIYSVEPVEDVIDYVWSLPYGATIVEGGNTNIITVDYSADAESGYVSVYGVNFCGDGQSSPPYAVEVHPVPQAPVVTMDEYFLLHSSAPEGNQWYLDGIAIEGATGQDYQAEENGYYFTIVTLDGCPSPLSNMMEVIITGIGETSSTGFSIYPVPNNGQFTVSISSVKEESCSLFVFNALGTMVYEKRDVRISGKHQEAVSLVNPAPGVYTVVLQGNARITSKKILISQ